VTNNSGRAAKNKWHSASWWASVGVLVAVVATVITLLAWQFPRQTDSGAPEAGGSESPPTTSSTVSETAETTTTETTTTSPADSVSNGESRLAAPEFGEPDSLYLSDVPEDEFIREPVSAQRGAASIANQDFSSSYFFRFTNCSACSYEAELNLPGEYSRFTGVFGLTDESRHDDVIDGVVYVSIRSQNGAMLMPPTKVEYPGSVPLDIDLTGVTRIKLTVTEGTNFEFACWCDAEFTR
jgi:NPCBM/NEW2 domain